MTRKPTKTKRFDLWLDAADLALLDELTEHRQISRQRAIEAALVYAGTTESPTGAGTYERQQRIPVKLDGLAIAQLERLEADASTCIRTALRKMHAVYC